MVNQVLLARSIAAREDCCGWASGAMAPLDFHPLQTATFSCNSMKDRPLLHRALKMIDPCRDHFTARPDSCLAIAQLEQGLEIKSPERKRQPIWRASQSQIAQESRNRPACVAQSAHSCRAYRRM